MRQLTSRQNQILTYLRERAEAGHAPTLDEICQAVGLRSRGSLHKHIQALAAAGLVEPANGRRRGVRLTEAVLEETRTLPLLGRIAAGSPIEVITGMERIQVPAGLRGRGVCYVLEVRGDSMVEDGILDGDWIVVEHRSEARNGELVVALINGEEATLKRLEATSGRVILHPANADFAPMEFAPEQVWIQGVVVGQMRRYE